jgi:hypothetical protein
MPDRALTLWQPWAWLVATGVKPIENRPRGFSHKSFRGDFWIHAAAESAASINSWPLAAKLCAEILGPEFVIPMARDLSFGSIIGRATITGIVLPRDAHTRPAQTLRLIEDGQAMVGLDPVPWHFPDQYGFKVERAELLARPVPCRGFQGFWRVPAPVLEQLKGAA